VRIIHAGRQAGKTHALVEHVKHGVSRGDGTWSRIIIVATEREAERLRRTYHLDRWQVFSYQSWNRTHLHPPEEMLLDNLEDWFYSQLGMVPSIATTILPIEAVTLEVVEAAQRAVDEALDAYGRDDLLEDEDGAPYPEPVQAIARELRLKMVEADGLIESLQARLVSERNHHDQQESGLLGMMGAIVAPKSSPPG
jgi:hypothetical protein